MKVCVCVCVCVWCVGVCVCGGVCGGVEERTTIGALVFKHMYGILSCLVANDL